MDPRVLLNQAHVYAVVVAQRETRCPEAWRGAYATVRLLAETVGVRMTLPGKSGRWYALGIDRGIPFATYTASFAVPGRTVGKEVHLVRLQAGSVLNVGVCEKLDLVPGSTGGGLQAEFLDGFPPESVFSSSR
ncbi:MAG: hypothetical protein HYY17_12215 [Planctomycetes bacterium]|nr:hypothetical protein [Planctomycetota bacterium]